MANSSKVSITKWDKVNSYLKLNFSSKYLIRRAICLTIACIIVLIPSLIMCVWATKQTTVTPLGKNDFWYIYIIGNPGIGFSFLSNAPTWVVYFVQATVNIILFSIILFCKRWSSIATLSFAFWGGMFNVIQRSIPWVFNNNQYVHCVIDYFKFGFISNFGIFNFPDMFIVCGTIVFVITFTTFNVMEIVKESKDEKSKSKKSNH